LADILSNKKIPESTISIQGFPFFYPRDLLYNPNPRRFYQFRQVFWLPHPF